MVNLTNIDTKESDFIKLINVIPDAIVIVNTEGKIKHANMKTQEIFGYDASELIGKEVEMLIPARLRNTHIRHREHYHEKPVTRPMGIGLDLSGKRKDGSEFPVDIMLSPIETSSGKLVISVVRDITELKKTEQEAKRRAKQLEDLVSALTHDLKTPLIAAKTSYEHLLEGYFGNLTKEQKEILQLLIQSNNSALRLVNNLLSVFKYESKSYKLLVEPVSISDLIDKATNTVKPFLEERRINLKVATTSFKFVCDPFELERVIVNLLTNSIKFTPSGNSIEIMALKKDDGTVVVNIDDAGKGIHAEELENIFERFWQSKKTNADFNSTGLGLYLCRQIVEAHGGKIWAESELGKGTKITFEIPEIQM